jgi:hypothetical protein
VSDPTSWLSIRPGWKVLAADGSEVGEVNLVTGDDQKDIFNGLAVATTALGRPRYVPAEQVAEITEGAVRLSLGGAAASALPEYREPEVGTTTLAADEPRERSVPLRRRLVLFFQRRAG